ncbi:hypothetical protein HCN44_008368 [Aphidius gifuensis]|uniref:Peroxisomal biogenesis factor 3 n=1 Tax=Aphidius gifuensis TaxID=684658 RepID=A0A834XR05_APHGI|nr:peroxisomal biogenesis factor 3 [Aphidius gifuensis]KAF7989694.1 hypothetical protein HCN44_008368 [Aphidius gifuensis]
MFSGVKKFINHHKRKFVFGGIIIGGIFVISKYTQKKIQEWHQRELQDMLLRTRRSQHFEGTEKSCNQTITSVSSCIKNSILTTLDSDKIINDLKNGTIDKINGWNKLKIYSIAKTVTIIYAKTMIVATLRVQVTLMGAHMFKNSQVNEMINNLDDDKQQKYLTLCSYFVDNGIQKLCLFIKDKVDDIVKTVSLADKLTIRDLEQIYRGIMSSILADEENNPVKNLASYMFDCNIDESIDDPVLKKIINETLDLMESEEIQQLMQSSVRKGFVLLIDHISEYFNDTDQNGITNKNSLSMKNGLFSDLLVDFNKATMPMAKIIPIINSQVNESSSCNDISTVWLQNLIDDDKFKTFGANIYEAFSF